MWQQSASSLRYLVLDELHTYDGAQGTDVAMLLRRLGLTLKSHWLTARSPTRSGLGRSAASPPSPRRRPWATRATRRP